jgi:hypothetical protein
MLRIDGDRCRRFAPFADFMLLFEIQNFGHDTPER